jgi:dihydroneopterin aldolase
MQKDGLAQKDFIKMKDMMTITLNDLRFFAFHGLYQEERKTGNEFMLDIEVSFHPEQGTIMGLADTINYASIYQLVKNRMAITTDLLETLAMDMANEIHQHFPRTHEVSIHIRKMHPPLANFEGNVGVRYVRSF